MNPAGYAARRSEACFKRLIATFWTRRGRVSDGGAPAPLALRLAFRFRLAEAYLAAYLAESGRTRAAVEAWAAVTLASASVDARRTAPSRALASAALQRVARAVERAA